MVNISSSQAGGYYQLPNQSKTPTLLAALATGKAATLLPEQAAPTNTSYLLDLSDDAKNYLSGNLAIGPYSSSNNSFLLSDEQKEKVQEILQQFKDQPYSQENFNKIQDALHEAGLSAEQLSMQDKLKNFSSVEILVNALSGRNSNIFPNEGSNTIQQSKKDNYMQWITREWQAIAKPAETSES